MYNQLVRVVKESYCNWVIEKEMKNTKKKISQVENQSFIFSKDMEDIK